MKNLLITLFLLLPLLVQAQVTPVREDADSLWYKPEPAAIFPGGEYAWSRFVERNFDLQAVLAALPDTAKEMYDSVQVRFIISRKGDITQPEISGEHKWLFYKPVLALLKKSPAWLPEIQGSGPVKSYVTYLFYVHSTADFAGITVSRKYEMRTGTIREE